MTQESFMQNGTVLITENGFFVLSNLRRIDCYTDKVSDKFRAVLHLDGWSMTVMNFEDRVDCERFCYYIGITLSSLSVQADVLTDKPTQLKLTDLCAGAMIALEEIK
jgi:hypothetical protein